MLSERINKLEYSAIRKLLPVVNKVKKQGKKIIYMNAGVPDSDTPREFFEAISKFDENRIAYASSNGLDSLREAISKYYKKYNLDYLPEEIFVTTGATEAINFALLCLTDKGDRILTSNPYYSNYDMFCQLAEISLDVFETNIKENYSYPKVEEIEKNIHSNTKAFLICNPSNPTGKVLNREEVETICKLAKKHNLFIIADEIYRDFLYDNKEFVSFADYEDMSDRVILIESISKRYSACGARIGAVLCKNKLINEKIERLCSARIAVATLDQIGAEALYKTDESYINSVVKEYEKRRDLVYNRLLTIDGVETNYPEGAFYMIVKLPVDDSEEFAKWILENFEYKGETIMLTPAAGFYKGENLGANEIRLVFALSQEKLNRGIKILEEGLKTYNKK